MESIQKQRSERGLTLADRIKKLERERNFSRKAAETKESTRKFKWSFKWRWKFNQSRKRGYKDMLLVIFLNKKNEIEIPRFMPIFDGNMVVWKNKPYEFDPRAIWTVRGIRGNPKCYLIKEIDRRPVRNKFGKVMYTDAAVSNMDLDEIRDRGDSTESDEFLIKAALKAQTVQTQKKAISMIAIIVLIAVVGGVLWFMFSGTGV